MLFWELYHGALPAARLALTLHNMDSQGECSQEEFMYSGAAAHAEKNRCGRHSHYEVSLEVCPDGAQMPS